MKPKIVIVGGGTAGWISLAYIVSQLDADITIIHSNEVDIIGVGESTTPTLRQIASAVGVDEYTWMKDAKATFKYGIKFQNWKNHGSTWFHSFDEVIPQQSFNNPLTEFGKKIYDQELTSLDYFLNLRQTDPSFNIEKFNDYHGPLQHLLSTETGHYNSQGNINIGFFPGYAYHVNAYDYSQCLRKHTDPLKYREIVDHVIDVTLNDNGVKSITLRSGEIIEADLFVDCTGFSKLLISKLTSFSKYKDLHNNAAVFGSVDGVQSNLSCTRSWAQDNGWIWEIPTWGRIGSGHVYCDDFISDDEAHDVIKNFWKERGHNWTEHKRVKFVGGRQTDIAIKNVVANGLSQSFLEPLEATSVMITCWTVVRLVETFKRHNGWTDKTARLLNTIMVSFLENTKNFVSYHYKLSDRRDTDYWRTYTSNTAVDEVNETIKSKLSLPWAQTGETLINKFNWASMLVGFDKPYYYAQDIPKEYLENYVYYSEMLSKHYKFITRNNVSNNEILQKIHLG